MTKAAGRGGRPPASAAGTGGRRLAAAVHGLRAILVVAVAMAASAAGAVELVVLSAGAVEPGIKPVLALFERDSGHTVRLSFAAAPALRDALRAAPAADVIVAPQAVLDETAAAGRALEGSAPIGKVGVGIAVRAGADVPDVTSAETLKAALGSADAVVFNRASTGVYVEKMLASLGVADAVGAKAERPADGASVMRRLLAGTRPREIGFAAATEIVLFKDQGIRFVGPLPAALQNYTSYVAVPWPRAAAAPATAPGDPARAAAIATLMTHLRGAQARAAYANAGIEPTH